MNDINKIIKENIESIEDPNALIIVTDPNQYDNPIVQVNDRFSEVTGYSREETVGKNCRFLQGPETSHASVKYIEEIINDENSDSVIIINYKKNGELFYNELNISPVYDEQGNLIYFIGISYDVTKQYEHLDEKRKDIFAELLRLKKK